MLAIGYRAVSLDLNITVLVFASHKYTDLLLTSIVAVSANALPFVKPVNALMARTNARKIKNTENLHYLCVTTKK